MSSPCHARARAVLDSMLVRARTFASLSIVALALACAARIARAEDAGAPNALVCEALDTATAYAASGLPRAVTTDDFNDDGIADLATAGSGAVSILLGQGAAGIGDGTYAAPSNIAVGGTIQNLTTGDFNDDGIADLALCGGSAITVLLGSGVAGAGDGTFGAAATFAAGTNPQSVTPADFNEDGITDLVTTNASSNSISILLGDGANGVGDGTFAAAVGYATGTTPVGATIGDFNEDEIWDIAVANNSSTSNSVSVLIGQGAAGVGDGTFASAINYPAGGANPSGITHGDFNEDGRIDLAVVNANSAPAGVAILLGSGAGSVGDGTFGAPTAVAASTGGRDIATADWNGDGRADLAVTNVTNDRIHVFTGNGAGTVGNGTFTLAASDSVGQDPRALARGDFDEDGTPDVATAKSAGAAAAVLLGGCAPALDTSIAAFVSGGAVAPVGVLRYINWTRGPGVMAVNVDVTRDGGANWERLASNVTESGHEWIVTPPATNAARLRVSDSAVPTRFDETNGDFAICAPFNAAPPFAAGADPRSAVAADFNDDGIRDLAIADFATNEVRVFIGNGSLGVGNGTFNIEPTSTPVAAGPTALVAADFDDDGILDLAVACAGANVVDVLRGIGANGVGTGTFDFDPICPPVADGPSDLIAADFDDDGILDLAVACAGANVVDVLRGIGANGVGTGTFDFDPICPPVADGPSDLVSGDFNEDGILDLAVACAGAGVIEILRGQGSNGVGTGTFDFDPICPPVGGAPSDLITGDFNGDGITDLAVASFSASALEIFPGNGVGGVGDGTFDFDPICPPITTAPLTLQKGDFNVDGITDLAIAGIGGSGGQAEILYGGGSEGAGNATFSCQMKFAIGAGATSIVASDFLEDNAIDLFVVCSGNATIAPLFGGCQDPDVASITVMAPNGGEFFPVGSERTISWTTSEEIDAVDVEISRDGGANWEAIALNTTESAVAWTVTAPLSQDALVRVSESALPNRADASNALFWIATPVAVPDPARDESGSGAAPAASALSAASPNPSAGEVRFALALPRAGHATLDVYDASGRLVRRLADRTFAAGEHTFAWDGAAADGARPSDGIYFLRAQWPGFEAVRKIVRVAADR